MSYSEPHIKGGQYDLYDRYYRLRSARDTCDKVHSERDAAAMNFSVARNKHVPKDVPCFTQQELEETQVREAGGKQPLIPPQNLKLFEPNEKKEVTRQEIETPNFNKIERLFT